MSWTDERIALLKRMWKEGKSAAEIAKVLGKGVTRNAIIGKAHRMGLSGRPSPIKKAPPPKKETAKKDVKEFKVPRKAAADVKPVKGASNALMREVEPPRVFEKEAIPPGGGVALIDLTERMCKWPIGDPRDDDFTFCGRGIRAGTPYCPQHAAMAYQTSSRNRGVVAVAVVANEDKAEDEVVSDDDAEDAEE